MKTFRYTKETYCDSSYDFDYEVDSDSLTQGVVEIIYDCYFNSQSEQVKKNIEEFISSSASLYKTIIEEFHEELRDYFRNDAFKSLCE